MHAVCRSHLRLTHQTLQTSEKKRFSHKNSSHDYCFPDRQDLKGSSLDQEPQANTGLLDQR